MRIQGTGVVFNGGRGIDALERALRDGAGTPAFVECPGLDQPVPVRQIAPETLKDKETLRGMRRADRLSKMAVLAAHDAWSDAGLADTTPERIGVIVATGLGPHVRTFKFLDGILDFGDAAVSPTDFSHSVHNAAAGYIASSLQARGLVHSLTDFDFAFQQGLVLAECWLREKRCDAVLLGAAEELGDVMLHVFNRTQELANAGLPAPFRRGNAPDIVPGEGAVCYVLTASGGSRRNGYALIRSLGADAPDTEPDLLLGDVETGSETIRVADYTNRFGSMPTGDAFQCLAATLSIRHQMVYAAGGKSKPERMREIDCIKRGRDGSIRCIRLGATHPV